MLVDGRLLVGFVASDEVAGQAAGWLAQAVSRERLASAAARRSPSASSSGP